MKNIFKKTLVFAATIIALFTITNAGNNYAFAASIKLPKITSINPNSSSSVTIKWKKVAKVSGYTIYQKKGNGDYKKIKNINNNKTTSFIKNKLNSATKYSYKIRTYKIKKGKKIYSEYSPAKTTYTKPSTPEITSIKSLSKSKIKLKWNKISKADGYAIYQKINGKYKKIATIKSNKKTSYTIKKLEHGTEYSFAIKSYINENNSKIYSIKSQTKSTSTQGLKFDGKTFTYAPLGIIYDIQCEQLKNIIDYNFYEGLFIDKAGDLYKVGNFSDGSKIKKIGDGIKFIKFSNGNIVSNDNELYIYHDFNVELYDYGYVMQSQIENKDYKYSLHIEQYEPAYLKNNTIFLYDENTPIFTLANDEIIEYFIDGTFKTNRGFYCFDKKVNISEYDDIPTTTSYNVRNLDIPDKKIIFIKYESERDDLCLVYEDGRMLVCGYVGG